MQRLFAFWVIAILVGHSSYAQDNCTDQDLLLMKGGWKKKEDANMRMFRGDSKMYPYLTRISQIFQSTFPVLNGLEAGWYQSMSDPIATGGPIAYNFNSGYFSWYCNTNLHKMMLSGETGTWAYVFVNSLGWLVSDQYDKLGFTVNGATVYALPAKKGIWKGYDLYQSTAHGAQGKCILLTHGTGLPWIPLTQEQYLRSLRNWVEDQKKKANPEVGASGLTPAMEAEDKREIAAIQNNPALTPERKQVMLDIVKKREDMYRNAGNAGNGATGNGGNGATANTVPGKMNSYFDTKLAVIDNYLGHAGKEQLDRPAVLAPKMVGNFEGSFSTEEQGGRVIITINPGFFDKRLPPAAPQLMVLYWRWNTNAAALQFKQQFEDGFPVEKLRTMLDTPSAQ